MNKQWDPTNTSVAEIHYMICDDAAAIANQRIALHPRIGKRWKGPVFFNYSAYNNDRLTIQVAPEFESAPPRVKKYYNQIGTEAMRQAISNNQEIFVGMILGEAKAGRNYFTRWDQAPERLF